MAKKKQDKDPKKVVAKTRRALPDAPSVNDLAQVVEELSRRVERLERSK